MATQQIRSGQILDGTIVNVDVATAAAIAWSKIDTTGAVLGDLGGTLAWAQLPTGAGTWTGSPTIDGTLTMATGRQIKAMDGTVGAPAYSYSGDPDTGRFWTFSGQEGLATNGVVTHLWGANEYRLGSLAQVGWSGSSNPTLLGPDLILFRDAAATLAQRNGTNAQAFRVYNTYASSGANHERVAVSWFSNVAQIITENGGTGTQRDLRLSGASVLLAGGLTDRWKVDAFGYLLAVADNSYDIGASGANRPHNLYLGGSLTAGGAIYERGRSTALGAWIDVPYDAANFTASAGTWGVDAGDQTSYRYMVVGKTMTLVFFIGGTDVSNTATLRLAIPGGFTAASATRTAIQVIDGATGTGSIGLAIVAAGGTYVEFITSANNTPFGVTTADNTYVVGQITFEVN